MRRPYEKTRPSARRARTGHPAVPPCFDGPRTKGTETAALSRANGRTPDGPLRALPASTRHLPGDFGAWPPARGSQSATPLPVGAGGAYSSRSPALLAIVRLGGTFCQPIGLGRLSAAGECLPKNQGAAPVPKDHVAF